MEVRLQKMTELFLKVQIKDETTIKNMQKRFSHLPVSCLILSE